MVQRWSRNYLSIIICVFPVRIYLQFWDNFQPSLFKPDVAVNCTSLFLRQIFDSHIPDHLKHLFPGSPYIRPMTNSTVIAGENAILRCPVTGYPIESITWEKGRMWNCYFLIIKI